MKTPFPCVHEVGTQRIVWHQPVQEETLRFPFPNILELKAYQGKWTIPKPLHVIHIQRNSLEEEWYRDSESTSAFITVLAAEIRNICRKHIVHPHLIVTLGADYFDFLGSGEDTPETRCIFRVEWWVRAQSGQIEIW
jgi:hypothetical protein